MAYIDTRTIEFSSATQTASIRLPPGKWTLDMELGGSTVELQAKSWEATDFKTVSIPLQDGSRATSTSTDDVIDVDGYMDYRLDVTAYSAAGTVRFSGNTIAE